MRILSAAEKCRRVARRIFFTTSVAGSFSGTDFCLIFAPCEGYDEPEILPSSTHPICLMSADGGQSYSLARQIQIEDLVDEILEIADDSSNDWIDREGPDGKKHRVFNPDSIRRSKLRIGARKPATVPAF